MCGLGMGVGVWVFGVGEGLYDLTLDWGGFLCCVRIWERNGAGSGGERVEWWRVGTWR